MMTLFYILTDIFIVIGIGFMYFSFSKTLSRWEALSIKQNELIQEQSEHIKRLMDLTKD